MKKLVTALCKKLFLLSIVVGAFTLMTSTAFAVNKSIDLSGTTTQRFALTQAAETFVPAIVITDDNAVPTITAVNDIRVVIPAGATNTTWDPTDTSIQITSAAFAKIEQVAAGAACGASPCTVTVAYADSNKTMIIPVGTNFVASDAITITTATTTMATFTAQYDDQGLGLSADGNGTADANCGAGGAAACDTQTFTAGENFDVGAATLSSAASQAFAKNQITTAISTITITDDVASPVINTTDDIRITVPVASTFIWDNTDTAATIGGAASAKVDATVTYEDTNRTLVVAVNTNLAAGDVVTISGLSFKTFSAAAANDNLDFEVANDNTVHATDDKTIGVGAPTIASAAAQKFATNQAAVAISAITLTEDASVPVLNSTDDIRITVPSGSNFIWDNADVSLTLTDGAGTPLADTGKITGCAASPCTVVLNAANFEDTNRTLLIPVAGAFAAGDAFVVSGINFKTFSARSAGTDNLDLEVTDDATVVNVDTAAISVSTPTILSSAAQQFTSGMNTQPMDWTITITEDASVAIIGSANDISIKIPSTFNMNFDSSDTTITVGGAGATVAKVAQSQGGAACANAATCSVTPAYFQADGTTACTAAGGNCRVMRIPIDVAALAAADVLTVTGASLFNFSSASAADNLELEVVAAASFGTAAVDEDNVTITVVVGSSAANQDKTGPAAPANFAVSNLGVLTWTDPTDTDLKEIQILRGLGVDPVNGTPIAVAAKGLGTYTDTGVVVGQTAKYILRAQDLSNNYSVNTAIVEVVIAAPEPVVAPEPITVTLAAQNESGQSGTATLTEANGQTTVTIATTGGPVNVDQPAHIHTGSCSVLGDAQYELTSVSNGVSETVLDVTLAELEIMAPLAINVHKSATEASIYYSCGNIAFGVVLEEVVLSENISEGGLVIDETGVIVEGVTVQNAETGASATIEAGTTATVQDEAGASIPYTGTILPPAIDAEQTVTGIPAGNTVASDVYNVETGATGSVVFDQPVTLVFPAANDVDTDMIYTMYTVDPTTGALSDPVECTVKLSGESKVFECQTTHLSKFIILAMAPIVEEQPVEEPAENPFVDVQSHWSKDYVTDLYSQDIVSGKDATHFKPDDAITRAEFTKIIVNAFGIEMKNTVTTMPFSDVKAGDWFVTYVDAAKTAGITTGYKDGTFKPNAQITRAEAVKILLEAAEVSLTGVAASEFKDVKQSEWYAKYVNYAAANEIVKGYADGTFGVDKNITRGETAKIVSLML